MDNFARTLEYLYQYIPKDPKKNYTAEFGLKRIKYFLNLLGNPQEKIKIIHIAGTSGKGSTAYLTSILLKNLGFRVGLHTSPHITDVCERFQLNNKLITEDDFSHYINELKPYIAKVEKSSFGTPTYFEILVALGYTIFAKEKVDYAVIETGLGGLYDGTNTVDRKDKLVILTKIGFDHVKILGNTLAKIAFQKAGIIQDQNTVITIQQRPVVMKVINQVIAEKKGGLLIMNKPNYKLRKLSLEGTKFDFILNNINLNDLKLGLIGEHQIENATLALAAVLFLSKRDGFRFDEEKIRQSLEKAKFAARFEVIRYKNKTIVVDGAHNPQKMSILIKTLSSIFPNKKFVFLIAFKKDKEFRKILKEIILVADKLVITRFFTNTQDWLHFSQKPAKIVEVLKKLGFNDYLITDNAKQGLDKALEQDNNILVVTGSLYLIAEIYPTIQFSIPGQ